MYKLTYSFLLLTLLLFSCKETDKIEKNKVKAEYEVNIRDHKNKIDSLEKVIEELSQNKITYNLKAKVDSTLFFIISAKAILTDKTISVYPFLILHHEMSKPNYWFTIKQCPNFRFEPYYLSVGGKVSGIYYPTVDRSGTINFNRILRLDNLEFGEISTRTYSHAIITNDKRKISNINLRFQPSEEEIYEALRRGENNLFTEFGKRIALEKENIGNIVKFKLFDSSNYFVASSFSIAIQNEKTFDSYHTFFIKNIGPEADSLTFLWNSSDTNRTNISSNTHYNFVDIYDFDKDGIFEIVISESEYEHEWFSILKLKNNEWENIYRYLAVNG